MAHSTTIVLLTDSVNESAIGTCEWSMGQCPKVRLMKSEFERYYGGPAQFGHSSITAVPVIGSEAVFTRREAA